MEADRKIFTLTELGKSLRSVIERNYTATYWIRAEIARLNYYPRSGHCYPELVDKSGNVVQAQMRSTIWAADFARINKEFIQLTQNPLKEGMSILFRASVGFHPVYGLSLQIWEIETAYTLGQMAMEKADNIEKLKTDGLFEKNKTLPFPLLPARLAIISVETSKGYSDFLNIIQAHKQKYRIWHFLFPSVLQGDKAAENMISQLRVIKKARERFDMVAIIRGGGGDIGLNCYDNYHLAREIALFPLPVVTGIGHATNETIAEMVAWANKITPTDVAYFVLEKFRNFEARIQDASRAIQAVSTGMIAYQNQKLQHLHSRLVQNTRQLLATENNRKDMLSSRMIHAVRNTHQEKTQQLDGLASGLSFKPLSLLWLQKCNLEGKLTQLQLLAKHRLQLTDHRLSGLSVAVRLLSPAAVLKRGYSLTLCKGVKLTDASMVKDGDVLHTRLHKGEIKSTVSGRVSSAKDS